MDIVLDTKVIRDVELFVFDKDGTLIDLYNYWYHIVDLRAQKLCDFYNLEYKDYKNNLMFEMGIDFERGKLRPEGPVGLLPRKDVQKVAEDYLVKLNCKDTDMACSYAFKEADELSLLLLDKFIKPIQGGSKLLTQIKKKGGKIAIATSDITDRAELTMRFLNIDGLIDFVLGSDKVKYSKPAPDTLKLISQSLGVGFERSVMVGDTKSDIQMGLNAGFKACIAVCSGLENRDTLLEFTPYVVEDISKIRIS